MGSDGADSSTEVAWDEVPLSELTSANVTYGVVQPGGAVPDGVPMIRVNNFSGHTLNLVDVMRISHAVERKYERTRLRADDVLITVVGSVGQVAVVPLELAGWNIARAVALIRPRSTALARWIAHFLRSPIAQHRMGIAANTTVQTTVNLKDLRAMRIPMPPEPIRRGISGLLGALDDRIDLLRQTNTTLEAIAQALFKSWFVDFDPVHAKAEGSEPEAMDAATAALFPSEFEESELGPIPKGWRVQRLGDVCRLTWGNTSMTKKSYVEEGFKAFSAAGQDGFVEIGERSGIGSVISAIGTVGVVHLAFGQWTAIKNTLTAQCDTDAGSAWLHHLLKTVRFPARGSTQQFISQTDAREVRVIIPLPEVRQEYGVICVALISRMEALQEQIRSLIQLRDTLLPRLISGKLHLPEATEAAETALG